MEDTGTIMVPAGKAGILGYLASREVVLACKGNTHTALWFHRLERLGERLGVRRGEAQQLEACLQTPVAGFYGQAGGRGFRIPSGHFARFRGLSGTVSGKG